MTLYYVIGLGGFLLGWEARTAYQGAIYKTIESLRRQMHGQRRRHR